MIPKILHYCWFGGKPLPAKVKQYLTTWQQKLPDFEIMQWDEHNFDVDQYQFTKEAHAQGRYAFVADVCRIYALSQYGGIYLDTDVEVLKTLDPLLHYGAFVGWEDAQFVSTAVIGSEKDSPWLADVLRYYEATDFGVYAENLKPNTVLITELLQQYGLKAGHVGLISYNIFICGRSAFSPKDLRTGYLKVTPETYCIHHFDASWLSSGRKLKIGFAHWIYKLVPERIVNRLRTWLKV